MKRIIIGLLISVCLLLTACEQKQEESSVTETQEIEQVSGGENCNH